MDAGKNADFTTELANRERHPGTVGVEIVDIRAMYFIEGDLTDPRVIELIARHVTCARAETGRGSAHALDPAALREPGLAFWSAWSDGHHSTLVAVGALKELTPDHGEVKSMYVAESVRGRGYGGAMLRHIIQAARSRGMSRLSLETGSWPYFSSARALYARHGFTPCEPFGDYRPDPNSVFMTLELR